MNGLHFDDVFPSGKAFLPVIHVNDEQQALDQSAVALDNGADGFFLIGHGMCYDMLLDVYLTVRKQFPEAWIGINWLDAIPEMFTTIIPKDISGIWTDHSGIYDDMDLANSYMKAFQDIQFNGLYFGGVAFKYQVQPDDLERATGLATSYMDVVTTSGKGTGFAASVSKVHDMATILRDYPTKLAVASGITPSNVHHYLPDVDCYLVATGISKDFHHFDPALVKELSSIIHQRK